MAKKKKNILPEHNYCCRMRKANKVMYVLQKVAPFKCRVGLDDLIKERLKCCDKRCYRNSCCYTEKRIPGSVKNSPYGNCWGDCCTAYIAYFGCRYFGYHPGYCSI